MQDRIPSRAGRVVSLRLKLAAASVAVLGALAVVPAAEAGIIADYIPSRHDRFVGGTVNASGNVANSSFLLADYDLSGIGVGTNGGVLISDRHVLAANHFRGGSFQFVGSDGVRRSFNVDRYSTTTTPGAPSASDVVIATLTTPVDLAGFGIAPMPLARSPLSRLEGMEHFVYDKENRAGRNLIDGGRLPSGATIPGVITVAADANNNQATVVTAYDFDTSTNGGTNGLGADETGVVAGDSGHPTLVVTPTGELAVLGTHFAVDRENPNRDQNYITFSSIASPYFDQIDSIVSGGGGVGLSTAIIAGPGDANADGTVNLSDFVILRNNFNTNGGFAQGDFNDDGFIDLSDFVILRNNFGNQDDFGLSSAPPMSPVPEPTSAALALPLALLLRRRR